MPGNQMTVAQLFREIESQTGMSVDYDASKVDVSKTVSVPAGTVSVQDLLDKVLGNAGYSCVINNSHIIVGNKPAKRESVVKGVVKDQKGEPVMGVGVFIKGTTNGTVTGLDGSFSINAGSDATLTISSIGYKSTEVAVAGRSSLTITIEEDMLLLEDAVVVGYGVQKKENLTGAISVDRKSVV